MPEKALYLHAAKWFRWQNAERRSTAPGRLCSDIILLFTHQGHDAYIHGARDSHCLLGIDLTCLPTLVKSDETWTRPMKEAQNKPDSQLPHNLHRHKAPRADLGLRLSGCCTQTHQAPLRKSSTTPYKSPLHYSHPATSHISLQGSPLTPHQQPPTIHHT